MSQISYARFCVIREKTAAANVAFRAEHTTLRGHLKGCDRPEVPRRVAGFSAEESAALTHCKGGSLLYAGCPPRLVIVQGYYGTKPSGRAWRIENGTTLCGGTACDLTLDPSEVARLAPELLDYTGDRWITFEFRKWPEGWSKRPGAVTMGEINAPED